MTVSSIRDDVIAAKGGDVNAYTRLVMGSRNMVCSVALAVVRDVSASEDVAQEAFVQAWRDLGRLRNPDSFLPWLRQLCRHRALHFLRGRRRHDARVVTVDDATLANAIDLGSEPGSKDETAILIEALDALPADARELLTLYYREGQSAAQVSRLLGISEPTCRKRLERARKSLRSDLLARFAKAVATTAPSSVFTASIVSGISSTATGTSVTVPALASKGTALAGMFGLGLACALGGIWLAFRIDVGKARDDRERRELRRLSVYASLVMLAFLALLSAAIYFARPWWMMGLYAAFAMVIATIYEVWHPRIISRGRTEARWRKLGLQAGIMIGFAGVSLAAFALVGAMR
jgi:RNA polymerase sigma factor (sigma-70 family)